MHLSGTQAGYSFNILWAPQYLNEPAGRNVFQSVICRLPGDDGPKYSGFYSAANGLPSPRSQVL